MGCLPIGAVGLLVLVLVIVASLRSCASGAYVVVPQPVPNRDLLACMKQRGWVGTVQGQRLEFDLGNRLESDFEWALRECDLAAG